MVRIVLFLSCLLSGCDDGTLLLVDLKTDLLPGVEFDEVQTVRTDEAVSITTPAREGTDFIGGQRVAEFSGLTPGTSRFQLRLLSGGEALVERPLFVEFQDRQAVTIVVTRDCAGVSCPRTTDTPDLTACLSGRCVDPGCLTTATAECGSPECSDDADCDVPVACATPVCAAGACLAVGDATQCETDEYCDLSAGCSRRVAQPDAGGTDAGALDGGVEDAGGRDTGIDAGPACAAPVSITSVEVSRDHVCAVTTGGALHCWGSGASGQTGHGDTVDRNIPERVGTGTDWDRTVSNAGHRCGFRGGAGELWCWGENDNYELGLGTLADQTSPLRIGIADDWSSVATGTDFTCGIRAFGWMFCWGRNDDGQLNTGNPFVVTTPARIGTPLDNWATISGGSASTCAIRDSGTLWCWGQNTDGQLGVGDRNGRLSQEQVVDADWASVEVGNRFACALKTDDTLWCWGESSSGRLGVAVSQDQLSPVQLEGTGWQLVDVSGTGEHACALRADGSLWCWGLNSQGELGLGDAMIRTTPTRVGTATDWEAVATGARSTCGIRGGTLYCWGENASGQLGLGDFDTRLEPVEVCVSFP